MELYVYDNNFNPLPFIIDSWDSLIWTERFDSCGDMELHLKESSRSWSIEDQYYLASKFSDKMMIVSKRVSDESISNGNDFIISGASLEYILHRRIVWNQTTITGNVQNGIKKLIDENIISPVITERKIPNFDFVMSTDEDITTLEMQAQYTGDNLYDVICSICSAFNIGFKITLESKRFKFKLYSGKDHSYDQSENDLVIFSSEFDNLISSKYAEASDNYKNSVLVAGEGEGSNRKISSSGTSSGMERYELFVDARDISSTTDNGTLSDTDYKKLLDQRGSEELANYQKTKIFDQEIDPNKMFLYNKDYFLGDIVQIENDYGVSSKVRITEFIYSFDESGEKSYPTMVQI